MSQMNFSIHDKGLKFALVLVVSFGIIGAAYGQDTAQFGHRIIPGKIIENSEGILEVYAIQNNQIFPQPIKDLKVISSDPSVAKIVGVEENANGVITNVKIEGMNAGSASIAIMAPGFSTDEFPITVYGNQNSASQLLLKVTPSSFLLNGPSTGYVTVELANSDGYPVIASEDTVVTLSLNDNSLLNLETNQLVIKKGDYFSSAKFNVKNSGNAVFFANAKTMKTASSKIAIDPDAGAAHLQLYVYPNNISSYFGSQAYALVELQNANGVPMKASDDIYVSVKVTGVSQDIVHSSSPVAPNLSVGNLVINRGSYWGYTKISTQAGIVGSYFVSIAANNYPASKSKELDVVNVQYSGSRPFVFDPLPVLTTGHEELMGVLHLADSNGNPLLANDDLIVQIDSTDKSIIAPKPAKIGKGFSSTLVFAQTGIATPSKIELHETTDNEKLSTPKIYGPTLGSLTLVADTLVPALLPGMESPLLLYMADSDSGASSYFPEPAAVSVSNSDLMQVQPTTISRGQDPVLLDTQALKPGSVPLVITAGSYDTNPTISILSPKGTQVQLSLPDNIVTNLSSKFSVQLLDENQLPVTAESDKIVTLIPNDKTIIDVPESVTIKKGQDYALFDATPLVAGNTELAMITDGLPLLKSDLTVTSLNPTVFLAGPNSVNKSAVFDATATANYNGKPLSGMKVDWVTDGANVISKDSVTDQNGNAKIKLVSGDTKIINLQSTISGGIFAQAQASQIITLVHPGDATKTPNSQSMTSGLVSNSLFIIIPVAISVVILKKKQKLGVLLIKNGIRKKALQVKDRMKHAEASQLQ